jgi:hypothetical protein
MKFADLNFAWADARVTVRASVEATRTIEIVRMACDTVAAPAAAVSLAAKAARRQQLAFAGHKTPVVAKAKNVDPRWVDVLATMQKDIRIELAMEEVKASSAAKVVAKKAKEVAVMALPKAPVAIKKAANTPAVKARLKAAKAARKEEAVIAKKAAVKAMKLEKVRAKAEADLAAAQAAVAEGINKEAIEAVVGTEVAQAAINAEFARLINSIKTLQARTYVFNGKDKVSYTDTRTGVTSYYAVEWKAHEVVSFKVQG